MLDGRELGWNGFGCIKWTWDKMDLDVWDGFDVWNGFDGFAGVDGRYFAGKEGQG
ncbi:MAG: hypothetical protein PUJ02_00230 [Anaerovibrio sp.]|uniref:hypothetical protein n=1 Tax=Anaerovibrio sp. TaxID=1872532 RepID=UPI00261AEE52|nr:hypothetical protein [Anaerovibrio sp.]MDD7676909.1 hypothetical protein [Anaerovibrio sp.]